MEFLAWIVWAWVGFATLASVLGVFSVFSLKSNETYCCYSLNRHPWVDAYPNLGPYGLVAANICLS